MAKRHRPAPRLRTHFEQIPVTLAKKLAATDGRRPEKDRPRHLIVAQKSETSSVRMSRKGV
jgi:hypothetical protein